MQSLMRPSSYTCTLNGVRLRLPTRPIVVVAVEGLAMRALERSSHYGRTPWIKERIRDGKLRMVRSVMPSTSEANFTSLLSMRTVQDHRRVGSYIYDPVRHQYTTQENGAFVDTMLSRVQQAGGNVMALTVDQSDANLCSQGLRFFERDRPIFHEDKPFAQGQLDEQRIEERKRRLRTKRKRLLAQKKAHEIPQAGSSQTDSASSDSADESGKKRKLKKTTINDDVSPVQRERNRQKLLLSKMKRRPETVGQAVCVSMKGIEEATQVKNGIDGQLLIKRVYDDARVLQDSSRADLNTLCRAFLNLFVELHPVISILKLPQSSALEMPALSSSVAESLEPLDTMLHQLDDAGVIVCLVAVSAFEDCRENPQMKPNVSRLDRLLDGFLIADNLNGHPGENRLMGDSERIELRSLGCGRIAPYDRASGVASVFLPERMRKDMRFRQDFVEYLLWEPGIDQALSTHQARAKLGVPDTVLGDMMLLADSSWIFVNDAAQHDLAQRTMPLRTFGSLWTCDLAFLTCGKADSFTHREANDSAAGISITELWPQLCSEL